MGLINRILGRKTYYAVFCARQHGAINVIGKKTFDADDKEIRWREKTYGINANHPTYQKGLDLYYFINIESGQLLIEGSDDDIDLMDHDLMDMVMAKDVISQLTENLTGKAPTAQLALAFCVGGAILGLIGFIVGQYVKLPGG